MQLSGNAAQEELERFADVRAINSAAAQHSHILKVLQFLPSRTCALWVGLHGLRHCIGVVVTMMSCVPGLLQACGAMFRLEVKSPFNTRGLLGMQVYFSQFQRTPFGMLRLDPQVRSAS